MDGWMDGWLYKGEVFTNIINEKTEAHEKLTYLSKVSQIPRDRDGIELQTCLIPPLTLWCHHREASGHPIPHLSSCSSIWTLQGRCLCFLHQKCSAPGSGLVHSRCPPEVSEYTDVPLGTQSLLTFLFLSGSLHILLI